MCGVCFVVGWVELLIEKRETEDDRDLMDGRNLMDDAPRWKRRP